MSNPTYAWTMGITSMWAKTFFANFDCTLLDVCEIRFGDNCMLGAECAGLYGHPSP